MSRGDAPQGQAPAFMHGVLTAAELQGHRIAISNPNTKSWNTTIIDVTSGYMIENVTAITIHGSMRKGQETYELTATLTLLYCDCHKRDVDLFAETISYEDVTVDVHSIVTMANVEKIEESKDETA